MLHDSDHFSALTRLAHGDQQCGRPEQACTEMQELRRVHHDRRHPGSSELSHRWVAGVVGAPHTREDQCSSTGELHEPSEEVRGGEAPGGRTAQSVRLSCDLGPEWVRKVS